MVESTAKLREYMLQVAKIDILDETGKNFKSTYQIMEELSKVWGQLNELERNGILDKIAGKRGSVAVSSALQNWSVAESARDIALTSEGSMDKQLEIYNQSIQASIDKFKVAFQELATDLLDSGLIKGIVDAGTTILKIIDELVKHIGVLGTAFVGLGLTTFTKTAISGAKSVSSLATASSLFLSAIRDGKGRVDAFNMVLGEIATGASGAGTAVTGLAKTLGALALNPVTIGVGAVATTAAIAYTAYKKQQEELYKQASQTTASWDENKSDVEDYSKRYSELNEQLKKANLTESERIVIKQQLLDLQNEISAKYGADANQLDLINGKFETQLSLISQISEKEAHRNLQNNRDAYQQSINEMEKDRTYTMKSNGSNSNLMKQIEWQYIRSGFKDNGDLTFDFTGNTTEADESIRQLIDRLETLKETASETERTLIESAIEGANDLLIENNKVLDKHLANYKSYLEQSLYDKGFGDELSEYAKRVKEYNEVLLGGNMEEILAKRSELLDYYNGSIKGILENNEEYKEFFDSIEEQIDSSTEKLIDWKNIINDEVPDINNKFNQSADNIRKTVNELKKLELDGVDIQAILGNPRDSMFGDLSQLARLFNPDIDLKNKSDLQSFVDFLEQLGVISTATASDVDLTKSSFEDFLKFASNSIDTIDKVNSALVNSFASGGLSARIDEETGKLTGDVKTIMDAYKGADVSELFERTAKGISVNRDALREMQAEQEKATKALFAKRIVEAYNEWQQAIIETGDANSELALEWKEQYDAVRLLAGAYDGATSAYQKWLDAQKMGEAGDMYDTIAKTALDRGKELYDQGLVGTNEFRAIAQLYSNLDLSTASVEEVTEAYEKGYSVVKKYFTEGQEGAVAFADKIVALGYATKDAEGNYDFFNGIDTKALADDLGISVDLVEAAFNKLGDYGFQIHFSFDDATSALEQFEGRLDELTDGKKTTEVDVDIHNDEQLREIAEYLLGIDDEEIKAQLDIDGTETVDELIDKLTKKYDIKTTVTTDSSDIQPAETEQVVHRKLLYDQTGMDVDIAPQTVQVEADPKELEVGVKPNSTEVDEYVSSLEAKKIEKEVVFHKNSTEVDNYNPNNFDRNVNYHIDIYDEYKVNNLPKTQDRYITYHIDTVGTKPKYKGTVSKSAFNGISHAGGTAHANGISLKRDENALINEMGAEIVVRPSEDSWMIFNDGKPTMGVPLKRGDIIFSADQTRELLSKGWTDEYAKILGGSYANGTVKGNAHATVSGGGKFKKATTSSTKKKSSGGGGGGGGGGNSTKEAKKFSEVLDEIEIKIDRVERAINNLDSVASNTFNTLTERLSNYSKEITKVKDEIDIQRKGYARYMQEANKYAKGLSSSLISQIKSGNIDIKEIKNEDTWKKIEAYRKWYEAALSCRDAIYKLQQSEADLWKQRFDVTQTAYENKLAQYQHIYDMMDSYIEYAENTGRISANKYRQKQITQENAKLKELQKEYDGLKTKMTDALKSGSLKKNSEGYYEMLNTLNSIQESIADTTANIAELNKSIRETNWEIFDKAAKSIANMRDELEFLYDILGEDLFEDNGRVTNKGIAGFGILASQYNISMAEAQKYAQAIKDINEEIANDKYNQDLIDRRQELYESQRKAIQQANDYKESIRDLVKDGIDKQIDSLKELIKEYEDLMDSQKDEMDYAKRVADQQENINKLQKQLNAYANDDSEEGATRRQRLQNELKSARENLEQTQEDRRISETKKLLSDLQDEYTDILNARLDNLDTLVESVIEGVDANADIIKTAIEEATSNVGYIMTNDLGTIFANSTNDLVSYFTGGDFLNNVTSITSAVNSIEQYYAKAEKNADSQASSNISSTTNTQSATTTSLSNAAETGARAINNANKVSGVDGNWIKDKNGNRTGWKFNDGTKATGWSRIDSKWYYFDSKGNMKTGLQTVNGAKYYVRRNSGRAINEWVQVNKKWYYFDKNGKALSGWQNLTKDGKKGWFFFNPSNNQMAVNSWVQSNKITSTPTKGAYYVNGVGMRVSNGKIKTKNGYRTFDKKGKWKGYKSGVKSVGADGLYWTNEGAPETIIRKSDGAVLTKLNSGDSVLNNKATNNMWDFANNPQKFLRTLGISNGGGNDVDLVINLNGIKNPSEFMDGLRRDKKFERFIQEITIGRINGHGSLAKNAIAF